MNTTPEQDPGTFDVAIVGGGLAGLALSIQLRRKGHQVILFEKEQYPFHKVCGEYISLESWDFILSLGIDLPAIGVPLITRLQVSAVNGKLLEQNLPLGGFGISRYRLDHELALIARNEGVIVQENTRVSEMVFLDNEFIVDTPKKQYRARQVAGSFGKRSNIDIKWKRSFTGAPKNKLNNYIGVKYHIRINFPSGTIALHNFENGYCGISQIEGNEYNLCYLTTAANLQKSNGDINVMEEQILCRNPHLKKILNEAEKVFTAPLTISQISFDKKSQVENHVLLIGDAAGMITPLCGNGMSMALQGSKIAAGIIHPFLKGRITRDEMEKQYTGEWNKQFANRLSAGRRIQRMFGSKWLSNVLVTLVKPFPKLARYLVKQTHGKPF